MIYKIVMDTLKPLGYPVYPLNYPGESSTYITFFQYSEGSALDADNEEKRTGYYIQVDIWTKDGSLYTSLVKQVKDALTNAGFKKRPGSGVDLYEPETKVYHRAFRFYYV
ncbi:MAG: hypothetical protein K0S80_1781 [Neobacillus sp.]|nr:hypothetical protein [Neobacillus sp.]